MGNNRCIAVFLGEGNRVESLGQGSYLIRLYQNCISGAALYALTMGMGEGEMGCTDAIYKNIDTIREALS